MKLCKCPFCGKEAYLDLYEDWAECRRRRDLYYDVGCKTEGCRCEVGVSEFYLQSGAEAIDQWNLRFNEYVCCDK